MVTLVKLQPALHVACSFPPSRRFNGFAAISWCQCAVCAYCRAGTEKSAVELLDWCGSTWQPHREERASMQVSQTNRSLHFSCHWYQKLPFVSPPLASPCTCPSCPSLWRQMDKWTNGLWYELSIIMPRLVAGLRAIGIRHPSAACPCLSFPGSGPLLRLAAQSPNFEFVGEAASQAQEKKKYSPCSKQCAWLYCLPLEEGHRPVVHTNTHTSSARLCK